MNSGPRQLSLRVSLDDEATLDNFFVPSADSSGARAMQHLQLSLQRWSQCDDNRQVGTIVQEFTWLWGQKGVGCSHLLQAVCHAGDAAGLRVFYLDLADADDLSPDILLGLEALDVLCLDHLQTIRGQADWEQALFTLYNALAREQRALLVAAECSPQQLSVNLPDLHSRWQSAAVFHIQALDDQHKAAALQLRAQRRGFTLSDEVAEFMVRRSERSMTALFDLLLELDRHSLETGRRVTVPLLKSLFGW